MLLASLVASWWLAVFWWPARPVLVTAGGALFTIGSLALAQRMRLVVNDDGIRCRTFVSTWSIEWSEVSEITTGYPYALFATHINLIQIMILARGRHPIFLGAKGFDREAIGALLTRASQHGIKIPGK